MFEKQCSICGKTFYTSYGHCKTCGSECSRMLQITFIKKCQLKKPKIYKSYFRKCKVCGVDFIAKRVTTLTCSLKCSSELDFQRLQIWIKNNPHWKKSQECKDRKKKRMSTYYEINCEKYKKNRKAYRLNYPDKVFVLRQLTNRGILKRDNQQLFSSGKEFYQQCYKLKEILNENRNSK